MNYLAKIGTMNSWIHDLKSVWLILVASLFIALVIAYNKKFIFLIDLKL